MFARILKQLVFITGIMLAQQSLAAPDNKGTEFIFAFQNNHPGNTQLLLFITAELDTQGVVEVPGYEVSPGVTFSEPFSVLANEVTTVELPQSIKDQAENGITRYGIHLVADDEVSVYGVNLQQYTSDAFMALPTDVLDNEYVVMTYDGLAQFASHRLSSQVAVIATVDGTLVEITPSVDAGSQLAGVPFQVTLDRFEVYQLSNRVEDLTGTVVRSSDPVAVMGSHKCADVPSLDRSPTGGRIGWCDHLVEMMPPLDTWGQSFAVIPLATRLNGSIVRILAAENGTNVKYGNSPAESATLNKNEFVEVVLTDYTEIVATGPVLVTQYSPGQAFDNVATDPFMMLIPPNEQFLQSYVFATPEGSFQNHYVNIAVPTAAIDSVLLDGIALDSSLFTLIGGSGLSGAQIPLSEGAHTLSAGQPFGIYVYGFNSYDSYGYPGGMALAETNPLGDTYAPNVGPLQQVGRTILAVANDSEDTNANGQLDAGEDVNGNGILDRRSEDLNGNGILDPGEDSNGNNILDRDRGVFKIDLLPGASNLKLEVLEFVAGQSPLINFRIDLVDETIDGVGRLRVEDLNGNATEVDVYISSVAVMTEVELVTIVSGDRINVDQATFTHQPSSIETHGDETFIEWYFDTITAEQVEEIGFDVILSDPQPGEQRLVTRKVILTYRASIDGDPVTTELGPQSVLVASTEFDLQIVTDAANYGPDAEVLLTALIDNLGTSDNSGSIEFIVEDENGLPVDSFASAGFGPIAPGASASLSQNWNTSQFIAGSYRVHAILKDSDGRVANETFSPFSIVNSTVGLPVASMDVTVGVPVGGGVFIEKQSYHTTDTVQVQSHISNDSTNTLLNDTVLKVLVLDPVGTPVFSQETPVNGSLVPGGTSDTVTSFMLDDAGQGLYQVQVTYVDNQTSAIIASESRQFTVTRDIALSVTGNVAAAFDELLLGDTQECTDTITSLVAETLVDLPVQKNLVNIATQQEVNQQNINISIAANDTLVELRNEDTSGAAGDFACVLRVDTGSGFKTIGFDTFSVYNLIANPGADQQALVGQTVILDASASRETNNLPLLNAWRFVSKPDGSNTMLSDVSAVDPSFFVDEQGVYVIELIVNNGSENSLPKLVRVTVPNRPAVADAGPDQAVTVGVNTLMDSSGSFDLDGDPLQYRWQIIRKPEGSSSELSDPAIANPVLPIDVAGVYEVRLIVNDGFEDSAADTVILNVGNVAPVADAGQDIVALIGDVITLDGSGSNDVNGDQLNYAWVFESVPAGSTARLENTATARPFFTIDKAGEYIARLVVRDGLESSAPDTVTVTVGNAAPTANAGDDQSANVGEQVFLDGSASSDLNGDVLSYRWNLISRPAGSTAQLFDVFTANPRFVLDVQGDYIVQLIVNDGEEDSRPDTVLVTVGNLRPVADAFHNVIGDIYTGDTIELIGDFSYDPDGDPLTYKWSFVDRPDGGTALFDDASAENPGFIIDVAGDYILQLVVNDGQVDSEPVNVYIEGVSSCVDNLAIRPKFDKISLTWDHNPDVEFVEIERATDIDGPYELIAESDSTYATYLDAGLDFGPVYYYRIFGAFPIENIIECEDFGEGIRCGEQWCNFYLDETESGVYLMCGDGPQLHCEILGFDYSSDLIRLRCDDVIDIGDGFGGLNQCEPGDELCEWLCSLYNSEERPEWIFGEFPSFDFSQCEAPPSVSERRYCQTQTIASTPIGRIRTVKVPDLTGMSVEQAQQTLLANRLVLGDVIFERTTAVPEGQVIRQDMPRNSIMPPNTAIDLVISTQGIGN